MNLYFDNATTSFPKPPQVAQSVAAYITECGGSYGRTATQRALQSSAAVERCRDLIAQRLRASNADSVFFTLNATMAANTVLKGLKLTKVLVSPLEHNAIMRPLKALGVEIVVLPSDKSGLIRLDSNIDTRGISLVIVNHQSNVNGVVQPIAQIAEWAATKGFPLMVDTSQSLGMLPVEVDYAIFTGHKGLHGITGVGGFYAKNPDTIAPLVHGGTGSRSDSYEMPEVYPDRLEAGTPNVAGIVGLCTALENPPKPLHTYADFLDMVGDIKGYNVFVSTDNTQQGELFSLTHDAMKPSEIAHKLYTNYGIETRSGLHCSPMAHRTLGTFPEGTVRISLSPYHTVADMEYLTKALNELIEAV